MNVRKKLAVVVLGACCLIQAVFAASALAGVPGALDLSFGERGVVPFARSESPQPTVSAVGMAVGAENELLVLQRWVGCGPEGCSSKLLLQRYLPNGQLDPGFAGGTVTIPLPAYNGAAVATSPDGKAVIATAFGDQVDILRFNRDGTPDSSFGGDGAVIGNYVGAQNPQLAVTEGGEVVLAANSVDEASGRREVVLARFLSNGDPDPGFGAGTAESAGPGWLAIPTDVVAEGMGLSPNGQIAVAGCCGEQKHNFVFESRRRPEGALLDGLDATKPWKRVQVGAIATVGSVLALPNGKVYVVGRANGTVFAAKLRADGRLERRFGHHGIIRIKAMNDRFGAPKAAVDDRGRLVVAGAKQGKGGPAAGLLVARRLAGGGRDRSFGNKSIVALSSFGLGRLVDAPVSIGLQSTGRIVLFGQQQETCVRICPGPSSALVRLVGGSARRKHHRHHRR